MANINIPMSEQYRIATELRAKGIHYNKAEFDAYLNEHYKKKIKEQEEKFKEPATIPQEENDELGVTDFIGNTLWGALDTASFGVAGAAWKKIDEDSYESVMADLNDTAAGRIGGSIGGLAGFLAPMGWVGKGTSLALRSLKTLSQAKKLKAGKAIVSPTTKTIQAQAGSKIHKYIEKNALKSGNVVSKQEAANIATRASDDIIGFTQKAEAEGFLGQISQKLGLAQGPGMHLNEVGRVNQAKMFLSAQMPQRLTNELASKGVELTKKQILGLSDELVEMLGKKSFNTIESTIARWGGGTLTAPAMKVVGSMAQEAVNFGLVGVGMDAVQLAAGELDLKEKTFAERAFDHIKMGGIFGGIKFVPGGTGQGFLKKITAVSAKNTKSINNKIQAMSLNETKALARHSLKNDASFRFNLKNKAVTTRDMRAGSAIGKDALPKIKKALIDHNNATLKEFRGPMWSRFILENTKDFAASIPRMAVGSYAFNMHSLQDGTFDQLTEGEVIFHLGLGALMTKGGKSLIEGKTTPFLNFGDKPFYYSDKMGKAAKNMKMMNHNIETMEGLVKQFDGSIITDLINADNVNDVENIIHTLKKHGIIYSTDGGERRVIDNTRVVDVFDSELQQLMTPIGDVLRSRELQVDPNATKENMKLAIKEIKSLESETLSHEGQPFFLNSAENISKARIKGIEDAYTIFGEDAFQVFEQQMIALTGSPDVLENREMINFKFPDSSDFSKRENMAIKKLEILADKLIQSDIIRVKELEQVDVRVRELSLDSEKIKEIEGIQDNFERSLAQKAYGSSTSEMVDMNSPELWMMLNQVKDIKRVGDVVDVIRDNKSTVPESERDVAKVKEAIDKILQVDETMNSQDILSDPSMIKIVFDETSGTLAPNELEAMQGFVKKLWGIAATGRTPSQTVRESHEVNATVVKSLMEKLKKFGMPDPVTNVGDTRLLEWYQKAQTEGVNRALAGLDTDWRLAKNLKIHILNGLVQNTGPKGESGVRFMMKQEISMADLENLSIPEAQKQEYVDAYNRNANRLIESKAVAPWGDGKKSDLSLNIDFNESMLSAVQTADYLYNAKKLDQGLKEANNHLIAINKEVDSEIKLLNSEHELVNERSDKEQIKATLHVAKEKKKTINQVQMAMQGALAGGGEYARAAAYVSMMKTMTKNGATLHDLTAQIAKYESKKGIEGFDRVTDLITDLQADIGRVIRNRPDIAVGFFEMREHELMSLQHREVDGFMKSTDFAVNSDRFFQENSITTKDLIDKKFIEDRKYDSNSDVLYELYLQKVILGKSEDSFVDAMLDLASVGDEKYTINNAPDKLKNDILYLGNMQERRVSIKKLGVNEGTGKGTYIKSEVSHGFLTDTYSDIFIDGSEMIFLDNIYMDKGGNLVNLAFNPEGHRVIKRSMSDGEFNATRGDAFSTYERFYGTEKTFIEKDDGIQVAAHVDPNKESISGVHYRVIVDENISIAIPKEKLDYLGNSFVKWYDRIIETDYVKGILENSNLEGAKGLFETLKMYKDAIIESKAGRDSMNMKQLESILSEKTKRGNFESVEDAVFTMFNVMYGERINGDWLQDAYISSSASRKHLKYKRLAQNLGYSRNSDSRRLMAHKLWHEEGMASSNNNVRLVEKYTFREHYNAFVIDDSNLSEKGGETNNLITDNRSVATNQLEKMRDREIISEEAYEATKKIFNNANSLNAEFANGMTPASRDFLDYLLLLNGKQHLIGKSAGQKPVGLTSYTDAQGRLNVFYNKTHYFYDSRLDPFFRENPDIDIIAFKSGAKKARKVNQDTRENEFIAYGSEKSAGNIPKLESGETIVSWLNTGFTRESATADAGLIPDTRVGRDHESVFGVKFNQSVSGVVYGEPHDVQITKQLPNWLSGEAQEVLFRWGRADMAANFGRKMPEFYDPQHVDVATKEAMRFINVDGNSDGSFHADAPNASAQVMWIETGGVPFSSFSKPFYDTILKKQHLDRAGVFSGITDAGGSPILRGNLSMDLDVPVFEGNQQLKIGGVKIGEAYLDREIHFIGRLGDKKGVPRKTPKGKQRPEYVGAESLTIVFQAKNRDVILDLETGKIKDPTNPDAKIKDVEFAELRDGIDYINGLIKSGDIKKYRDLYEFLNLEKEGAKIEVPINKDNFHIGIHGTPSPRTGPHDNIVLKIQDILPSKDGGLMEVNPFDLTMRLQRDFDTDKLFFYMDTPFLLNSDSYGFGGKIHEANPLEMKKKLELDPYNNQSMKETVRKIPQFKAMLGTVVKTQRKLTYIKNLFEGIEGQGIEVAPGVSIKFNKDIIDAQQRIVDDLQASLDMYDGFPNVIEDLPVWMDKTFFGNTHSEKRNVNFGADNPFFHIVTKDSKTGNDVPSSIENKGYKAIVEKIMNDYGQLLSVESDVYEFGQKQSPKYSHMVTAYRDFAEMYKSKRINGEFYHYVKNKVSEEVANQIFFGSQNPKIISNEKYLPVLSKLTDAIANTSDPFLKSLKAVAKNDVTRVQDTYSSKSEGSNAFNDGVNKWLGLQKGLALEAFRYGDNVGKNGIIIDQEGRIEGIDGRTARERQVAFIEELWKSVGQSKKNEQIMVQLANVENQISRSEWILKQEQDKAFPDAAAIKVQQETIELHRLALDAMLGKMSISPDQLPENMKPNIIYPKKKGKNKIDTSYQTPAIRDRETGKLIVQLKKDQEWYLDKRHVAITNPVILKPITSHDLIDGVAWANTTLGYYSKVQELDLKDFKNQVKITRNLIQKRVVEFIKKDGVKDWSKIDEQMMKIIEDGLVKIGDIARGKGAGMMMNNNESSSLGALKNIPIGKENYGKDFLMTLLVPNAESNPNEYHYSPITSQFLPAVRKQSKMVVQAVMKAIDHFDVVADKKQFIGELAQTHRGYYDATVAGSGMNQALVRLGETSFEGGLHGMTVNNVLNRAFMPRNYVPFAKEGLEIARKVNSEFAELYRQMLEESALTDPVTALRIKRQLLGQDGGVRAYEAMFNRARGEITFDGLNARRFGEKGGQFIGELISDSVPRQGLPRAVKTEGNSVPKLVQEVVGYENEHGPENMSKKKSDRSCD